MSCFSSEISCAITNEENLSSKMILVCFSLLISSAEKEVPIAAGIEDVFCVNNSLGNVCNEVHREHNCNEVHREHNCNEVHREHNCNEVHREHNCNEVQREHNCNEVHREHNCNEVHREHNCNEGIPLLQTS